jgi:para-aminobenzoate synthetase component 1
MIVDLLRNDLNRVSLADSVRVVCPHRLISHPTVHHLEAEIDARLRPDLTLGDFLDAVCPAGSITGAPKIEVMRAIQEFEGRDRGYFMGHIFYLDDRGRFDSSILIRTLVRDESGLDEFAAGSGLVVHSDPERERREVEAKCRVVVES